MDSSQASRETRLLAEGRELMLEQVLKAEVKGQVGSLPYQNYLIRQELDLLAADIVAANTAGGGAGAFKKYALYLGSLDPQIVALRAIQAALESLFKTGAADTPQPIAKPTAQNVGKAVYGEYLMRHFKELNPKIFNSLVREYDKSMTRNESHLLKAFKAKFANEGYEFPVWGFGDMENVGSYLVGRMSAHGFLTAWTATERKKGKAYTVGYLQLPPELRSASLEIMGMIADAPRVAGPMIEPPRDWSADTNGDGGFHTTGMQRLLPYAVQGVGPVAVAPNVIHSLNALQQRAWRINKPVLLAVRALSLRRDFGDVVSADPGPKPEFNEEFTPEQKKDWKGRVRAWYTDKKTRAVKHRRSQKVFSDATELMQYPAIWFSYYADFRGRKYARSSTLSPQGSDLEKGIILLDVGRTISTASGLHWFKVHGANKWGLDKKTLPERVKWVDDNHEFIIRMGQAPDVYSDWSNADTPVQFLAWAIEYAGYHADPDKFLSRIPLGQDGTCNGLQNFSALMRDSVGGTAVNLVASPAPRDIYHDVAVRVTELLREMPVSTLRDAWLAHGINRKITKRTTMTLPYGCTRYACSLFVNEDYIMKEQPPEIQPEDYGSAANFLSHVIWKALDDVVVKAREVMEWLKGWAKHTAAQGLQVTWRAPNGLKVISEYERMKIVRVRSVAFKTDIRLYKPEEGKPDLVKIANAVAPNFVHSLDASHLDRVVIRATAEGMHPVTIHDDFGVHADDTERFHEIIREEFVAMYQDSTILEDMATYSGYGVPIPALGDLDLQQVLNSPYFFA